MDGQIVGQPAVSGDGQYKGKGALDAFLNLFALISLGWMSFSFGAVLFEIIGKFFSPPNVNAYNSFSQAGLKFAIASVIIITPIFLVVIGSLHKNYKTNNLNFRSGIHRWLTYLMLLISALTVIGRLVYQLFRFLDGDFTLAVILRSLVILIIAGGIFGYYFYDLRRRDYSNRSLISIIFFYAVIVLTLGSVVGGFMVIDSPQKARDINFDRQRVNNLSQINDFLQMEAENNKILPENISAAKYSRLVDPETNKPFEYRRISTTTYEICAVFALSTKDLNQDFYGTDDWYYHDAGRQCFTKSANLSNLKSLPVLPQ